jgi:hypothetical protein
MYVYSNYITNAYRCFYGKSSNNRLNIYINKNTNSLNTFLSESSFSIIGNTITWTNDFANNVYYNTTSNIYIYPVTNVHLSRLQVEYSDHSDILDTNDYIDISDSSAYIDKEYLQEVSDISIDSGYAQSIPINNINIFKNTTIIEMGAV